MLGTWRIDQTTYPCCIPVHQESGYQLITISRSTQQPISDTVS